MKTILEIKKYGENDIRFITDLDHRKRPQEMVELIPSFLLAMTTTLWGGNEVTVLGIIRALAIADLAASVNREEMIRLLDTESSNLSSMYKKFLKEQERHGLVVSFPAGMGPTKTAC